MKKAEYSSKSLPKIRRVPTTYMNNGLAPLQLNAI